MNQRFLQLLIPAVCIVGLIISGVFLIPEEPKKQSWDRDFRLEMGEDSVLSTFSLRATYRDSVLNPAAFFEPSHRNRPWLVWYWPGTDVNLQQAIRELTWIAAQGFGGVEIQVTGKGIPVSERVGQFRDPKWSFLLEQVSLKAQQFGLEVDWVIGPGIPAEFTRGQHGLTWGEMHIRGDRKISFALPIPNIPIGHRLANILNRDEIQDKNWIEWQPDSSRLLGVWAAKPRSDQRSATFWTTTDIIQLDPDSTWSLNRWVKGDSIVGWQAPKGPWKIIAAYETDLFTSPHHSVAAFQETIIDPYSGADLRKGIMSHPAFLALPRDSLRSRAIRTIIQSTAADRLIPENTSGIPVIDTFEQSLLPLLLARPLAHHAGASRLHLDRQPEYRLSPIDPAFQYHYEDWLISQQLPAAMKSLRHTIQESGYASKLVVNDWDRGWFDMASQVDIAGFDSHISGGHRLAASLICDGAYFGGKKDITAYIGQVPDMAYANTPQHLKTQIDRAIFTGATEIAVHGKPFRHYTGNSLWDPATTHGLIEINHGGQYDEANPFHSWWPELWQYGSRLQYLSRLGRQQTDILVLYPFTDFPSTTVDSIFSLILDPLSEDLRWNELSTLSQVLLERKTDSLVFWLNSVKPFIQSLEEHGYSWSWMSESGISELAAGSRALSSLYPGVKALIIPERGSIRLSTVESIDYLHQANNLNVYLLGKDRPTARELFRPDSSNLIIAHILRSFELPFPINSGSQLIQRLTSADLKPEKAFAKPSRSIRQRSQIMKDGSRLLWLLNMEAQPASVSIVFGSEKGWVLDPETGFAAPFIPSLKGITTINLSQYENKIIWLGNDLIWPDSLIQDNFLIKTPWLEQLEGATFEPLDTWEWVIDYPKESPEILMLPDTGLWDWQEDEVLAFYHGEISYTLDLRLTQQDLESEILLDLGQVFDAVEVEVNTQTLPIVSWPPFRYEISKFLHPGLNTIQVWVTNARRNERIGDRIEGKSATTWSRGQKSELRPSGLLGPVQLWRIPPLDQKESPEM